VDTNVIRHVYNTSVSELVNHVSYNGGPAGIHMSASDDEKSGDPVSSTHIEPVPAQIQHAWAARNDPKQRYSANHGAPPVTATALPKLAVHPRDLPPIASSAAPDAGKAELVAKQNQDREKLQKKQDKEDQEAKQKGNPAKMQQVEQQHQQQTQEMVQRHAQQMQQKQQRQ
jgi:hypothetical protein